jgi:RNA polymerase-binding transcription factor DksA
MKCSNPRRTQLLERRAELLARIEEVEIGLESQGTKDWEDLATEREGDEVLERQGLQSTAEIAKIDAALKRLDAGEYGFCVKCGIVIGEERLDLLPWTPFCRGCAV